MFYFWSGIIIVYADAELNDTKAQQEWCCTTNTCH